MNAVLSQQTVPFSIIFLFLILLKSRFNYLSPEPWKYIYIYVPSQAFICSYLPGWGERLNCLFLSAPYPVPLTKGIRWCRVPAACYPWGAECPLWTSKTVSCLFAHRCSLFVRSIYIGYFDLLHIHCRHFRKALQNICLWFDTGLWAAEWHHNLLNPAFWLGRCLESKRLTACGRKENLKEILVERENRALAKRVLNVA